ncbi:MAG: CHASE2 domain-containing protein [Bacteroidota bacterium]
MKKLILDAVFATIFVFFLMWMFSSIAAFKVFEIFDPIGEALSDMEITDVVFSELREDPIADTAITLVNIGNISRGQIAQQISIISRYEPKIMGFDSFFSSPKQDTLGDLSLSFTLSATDNMVMVSKLLQSDSLTKVATGEEIYDSLKRSHPMFRQNVYEGFANLETDADYQQDFKTCRRFPPTRDLNGKPRYAFGVRLAMAYDSAQAKKFLKRNNTWETINYRGNAADYFQRTNFGTMFTALDVEDVLTENFDSSVVKDKIVIFGYMGDNFLDTDWEDKFHTPMNKKYAGKANPDMYGVVIHANIVSMILRGDHVNELSETQELILAILMCFLNLLLFSVIYRKLPKWYDGLTKLIQLVEILLMTFLMVMVFDWYDFKLNLSITLVAVALTGDSLEVYFGVVRNLFTQQSRRQLFRFKKNNELAQAPEET